MVLCFDVEDETSAEFIVSILNDNLLKEKYKANYIVYDEISLLEKKLIKHYKIIINEVS